MGLGSDNLKYLKTIDLFRFLRTTFTGFVL